MKKVTMILFLLMTICIPHQVSFAQASPCPTNNEQAKQVLKQYFSKEQNIKLLKDQYTMAVSDSSKDQITLLTGAAYEKECRQLIENLDWLQNQQHYSIYEVANHYFIVLYSFTEEGKFQWSEIPIINSDYKVLGTIANIYPSK